MLKSLINKLKRKIYFKLLKQYNPQQYEFEYKYAPEQAERPFELKSYLKNNLLAIIDLIIALAGLIIALISLFKQVN